MSLPSTTTNSVYGDEDAGRERTPPPQPSESSRRPTKLRSSCDECAAAKVRCNKGQPECARCIASGVKCVYGLSRKFGKPRKRAATQGDSEEKRRRSSGSGAGAGAPVSASMSYPHLQGQAQWDELLQGTVGNNTLTPSWSGNGSGNVNGSSVPRWDQFSQSSTGDAGTNSAFNVGKDSASLALPSVDLTDDVLMMEPPSTSSFELDCFRYLPSSFDNFQDSPFSTNMNETVSLNHIQSRPSLSSPGMSQSSTKSCRSPSTSVSQKPETHNCDRLAYSTLENLEFRQEKLNFANPCPTSNDFPTTSLDNVLSQNKDANNAVLELLNCSCARDPHLAMLYASIISKILIWYQVAGGCKKSSYWGNVPGSSTPSSTSSTSLNTMSSTRSCSVSNQPPFSASTVSAVAPMAPVALGSFNLDEKDHEAFRKYLLLSELKKLGQVIDLFSGLGAGNQSLGAVGDIYASLGGWLKSELAGTIRVLKEGIEDPGET